ncbi:hypothetical protein STEG23_001798, partial [Scotinomys teguina]
AGSWCSSAVPGRRATGYMQVKEATCNPSHSKDLHTLTKHSKIKLKVYLSGRKVKYKCSRYIPPKKPLFTAYGDYQRKPQVYTRVMTPSSGHYLVLYQYLNIYILCENCCLFDFSPAALWAFHGPPPLAAAKLGCRLEYTLRLLLFYTEAVNLASDSSSLADL